MRASCDGPYIKMRRGERLRLAQLIKNRSYVIRPTRRLAIASDPDADMFLESATRLAPIT
jgi:hypothetical protein